MKSIFPELTQEERINEIYSREDWGRLLKALGYSPYNTEFSARSVAEVVSHEIRDIGDLLVKVEEFLKFDENTKLTQELLEARMALDNALNIVKKLIHFPSKPVSGTNSSEAITEKVQLPKQS